MTEKKERQFGSEKYRFFVVPDINLYDDATAAVESLVAHKMFTNTPLRRLQKDSSDAGKRLSRDYADTRRQDIADSVITILEKVYLLTGQEFPFEGKEKDDINMMMKKALIYEIIQCLEIDDTSTATEAQGDLIFNLLRRMHEYKQGR